MNTKSIITVLITLITMFSSCAKERTCTCTMTNVNSGEIETAVSYKSQGEQRSSCLDASDFNDNVNYENASCVWE